MNFKTQEELKDLYSGISASSLNYYDVSPKYFRDKIDRKIIDRPTPESLLGNRTHEYILEPDKFKEHYIQLSIQKPKGKNQEEFCTICASMKIENPEAKAKDIAPIAYKKSYKNTPVSEDAILKKALPLYEELNNYITYLTIRQTNKETISDSDMRYLVQIKNVLEKHPKANELLFEEGNSLFDIGNTETFNEKKILWEFPEITLEAGNPVVCKSFIDRFTINHKDKIIKLIDFKTTNKLHDLKSNKIKERKYHRQLAFYWLSIFYFIKTNYPDVNIDEYDKETYIVAVQTPNRYQEFSMEAKVVKITEATLNEGLNDAIDTVNNIVWHIDNDVWDFKPFHYDNQNIDEII